MKYLCIDFGLSHLGFAVSGGDLAEPLRDIVTYKTEEDLYRKTINIIHREQPNVVVVGMSEGVIGAKAQQFGDKLKQLAEVKVVYQDEDFSTKKAVSQMIAAGNKKSDRQTMDHNVAAANILQEHLDKISEQV